MKFDKDHLVDIKSLTLLEAQVFLEFLAKERGRHAITANKCAAWVELWSSEYDRQVEEVKHIDSGVEQVKEKFGLGEK